MKPFQVTVKGVAVEVFSIEYNQNPRNPSQNLWRLGVSNGETQAFVYVPTTRSSEATKNFKATVQTGAIISFTGIVDRDYIIVQGLTVERKARQQTIDFMEEAS